MISWGAAEITLKLNLCPSTKLSSTCEERYIILQANSPARLHEVLATHAAKIWIVENQVAELRTLLIEVEVVITTRNQMLRITRKANGEVVFKVSGQLSAENVAEMEALIAAERKGRRIVLDCTDLRSVDGEAVKFLEKWEADSIKLKNCGLYIREWIRRERLERESDKSAEK
jgi:MFS superfamily sulfate permease-like transporter